MLNFSSFFIFIMDDVTNSCMKRIKEWKEPLSKPSPNINDKQKIEPDFDTSILYQRFPPSNKVPIGKRYRMQSVLQKHLSAISKDSTFCRTEANFKELEIFNDSINEQEYQQNCLKAITQYKEQEKLLTGLTIV